MVDTGVQASNPEIAGRVSPLSQCAAITFICSNGYADDNGHGTATASIAAGQYNANLEGAYGMSGVAPAAVILSEKVLNASGSGYDFDVANGINLAVKNGAQVINLSLTYLPTQTVVNAINNATNNGVVVVWAGGNSSAPLNNGANTLGLSATALSHIIFVGSVNSSNGLSSFSNTPGTGSVVTSGGSATYASLWLMAPGENIIAPGIQFGPGAYAYWTGTSMSTPEVAGAVALLEATWPILKTNGTATQVLFASATPLGANTTYGNGLLNLTAAFSPIGPLSVVTTGGTMAPVAGAGGGIATSSALGALPSVAGRLSHYTAFDTFERNFTVNLSGLIAAASRGPTPQVSYAPPLTSNAVETQHGGRLMLMGAAPTSFAQSLFGEAGAWRAGDPFSAERQGPGALLAFAAADGTYFAMGHGVASGPSFAEAAWGADELAAQQDNALGVASALVSLAQGGYFGAFGGQALGPLRIAATWSSTPPPVGSALFGDLTGSSASATAVAVTAKAGRRLSFGVTYSTLRENNALLGSTYGAESLINLGDRRKSQMIGGSATLDLGGRRAVTGAISTATTGGGAAPAGLIQSVSALRSMAWGASFIQGDAFRKGDSLSISVRQPLRVVSGSAAMVETGVDALGFPVTNLTQVSLAPNGRETDTALGYSAPASKWASFRGEVAYRSDADNIAGRNDIALRFGMNVRF